MVTPKTVLRKRSKSKRRKNEAVTTYDKLSPRQMLTVGLSIFSPSGQVSEFVSDSVSTVATKIEQAAFDSSPEANITVDGNISQEEFDPIALALGKMSPEYFGDLISDVGTTFEAIVETGTFVKERAVLKSQIDEFTNLAPLVELDLQELERQAVHSSEMFELLTQELTHLEKDLTAQQNYRPRRWWQQQQRNERIRTLEIEIFAKNEELSQFQNFESLNHQLLRAQSVQAQFRNVEDLFAQYVELKELTEDTGLSVSEIEIALEDASSNEVIDQLVELEEQSVQFEADLARAQADALSALSSLTQRLGFAEQQWQQRLNLISIYEGRVERYTAAGWSSLADHSQRQVDWLTNHMNQHMVNPEDLRAEIAQAQNPLEVSQLEERLELNRQEQALLRDEVFTRWQLAEFLPSGIGDDSQQWSRLDTVFETVAKTGKNLASAATPFFQLSDLIDNAIQRIRSVSSSDVVSLELQSQAIASMIGDTFDPNRFQFDLKRVVPYSKMHVTSVDQNLIVEWATLEPSTKFVVTDQYNRIVVMQDIEHGHGTLYSQVTFDNIPRNGFIEMRTAEGKVDRIEIENWAIAQGTHQAPFDYVETGRTVDSVLEDSIRISQIGTDGVGYDVHVEIQTGRDSFHLAIVDGSTGREIGPLSSKTHNGVGGTALHQAIFRIPKRYSNAHLMLSLMNRQGGAEIDRVDINIVHGDVSVTNNSLWVVDGRVNTFGVSENARVEVALKDVGYEPLTTYLQTLKPDYRDEFARDVFDFSSLKNTLSQAKNDYSDFLDSSPDGRLTIAGITQLSREANRVYSDRQLRDLYRNFRSEINEYRNALREAYSNLTISLANQSITYVTLARYGQSERIDFDLASIRRSADAIVENLNRRHVVYGVSRLPFGRHFFPQISGEMLYDDVLNTYVANQAEIHKGNAEIVAEQIANVVRDDLSYVYTTWQRSSLMQEKANKFFDDLEEDVVRFNRFKNRYGVSSLRSFADQNEGVDYRDGGLQINRNEVTEHYKREHFLGNFNPHDVKAEVLGVTGSGDAPSARSQLLNFLEQRRIARTFSELASDFEDKVDTVVYEIFTAAEDFFDRAEDFFNDPSVQRTEWVVNKVDGTRTGIRMISAENAFRKYDFLLDQVANNSSGNLRGMVIDAKWRQAYEFTGDAFKGAGHKLGVATSVYGFARQLALGGEDLVQDLQSDSLTHVEKVDAVSLWITASAGQAFAKSVIASIDTVAWLAEVQIQGSLKNFEFVTGWDLPEFKAFTEFRQGLKDLGELIEDNFTIRELRIKIDWLQDLGSEFVLDSIDVAKDTYDWFIHWAYE